MWRNISVSKSAIKHSIPDYILFDLLSVLKNDITKTKFTEYRNALLTYFLLTTGTRISAALKAKWSDISSYNNIKIITLYEKGGKEITKPLPKKFYELLMVYYKKYSRAQHKQKIYDEYGNAERYENGELRYIPKEIQHIYIFCGRHGGMLHSRSFYRWFKMKLSKYGATAAFTVHSLRHTAAFRMYVKSGKDIMATANMLGHSSIVTTQRYIQELSRVDSNLPELLANDLLGE